MRLRKSRCVKTAGIGLGICLCALVSAGDRAPAVLLSAATRELVSDYYSNDPEALAIARGEYTVQFPAGSHHGQQPGIVIRLINGYRMVGFEPNGMPYGLVIGSEEMLSLDRQVATMEKIIRRQARRLKRSRNIFAPDFKDSLPQIFAQHMFSAVLDWFNAGPTRYQSQRGSCLLANMIPALCGALVDFGVTEGSCDNGPLRATQIVQTPELFGFTNVRREILPSEDPIDLDVVSTYQYVATVVHEFTHDMDVVFSTGTMQRGYPRSELCSSNFVNFQEPGTPFTFGGVPGSQDRADFVSEYASGLSNPAQDYRFWEDAAESVTAYIVTPEYFRTRMQGSASLAQKYAYIRERMFGGAEFENPAHAGISSFAFPPTMPSFQLVNPLPTFVITNIRVIASA